MKGKIKIGVNESRFEAENIEISLPLRKVKKQKIGFIDGENLVIRVAKTDMGYIIIGGDNKSNIFFKNLITPVTKTSAKRGYLFEKNVCVQKNRIKELQNAKT